MTNTRPTGVLDNGDAFGSGATGLLLPKTAAAAVNATLCSSSNLFWRVVKTLRSKNDGFEPSLSTSPIGRGGVADDFAERVLNSLMKGRTVRRTGPLGVMAL